MGGGLNRGVGGGLNRGVGGGLNRGVGVEFRWRCGSRGKMEVCE